MGLFNRLFGRQKEEKPAENVPEEPVEVVSEDNQRKNLEAEKASVGNVQSENLDEQKLQTELKERIAEDKTRLETIQEKVGEIDSETAETEARIESDESDSQVPESNALQSEMADSQPVNKEKAVSQTPTQQAGDLAGGQAQWVAPRNPHTVEVEWAVRREAQPYPRCLGNPETAEKALYECFRPWGSARGGRQPQTDQSAVLTPPGAGACQRFAAEMASPNGE